MATSYEDRRGALLTQQAEKSPSRPFVTGALELLEALAPPRLTAYGFAFFDVLQLAEIRLTNGTHLTDSTHTLDDVAHVVAAYFATTEEQEAAAWWKERHASSLGAIEVRAARKWYGVALLKCPAVKEVRLFF